MIQTLLKTVINKIRCMSWSVMLALPMVLGAVIGASLFFFIEGTPGIVLGILSLVLGNFGGILLSKKIAERQ